jgi:hypothetical protein
VVGIVPDNRLYSTCKAVNEENSPIEFGTEPTNKSLAKSISTTLQGTVAQVELQEIPCHGAEEEQGFSGGETKLHGFPYTMYGFFHFQSTPLVLLYNS